MAKEKMSIEKKVKLIYSGELIFIAIVFLVLATLELCRVLKIRDWVLIAFNWITIFGGAWMIADFIWTLVSPKKRAKNSLLDKCLLLPLGIYLIVFDIICFAKQGMKEDVSYDFRLYMMTSAFYYVAVIYIFQGFYHYKHPIPSLVAAIKQEEEEAKKKEFEQEKPLENQAEETEKETKD